MGVETTISHDDGEPHPKIEDAKTEGIVVRHYVPATDEERALDRRVNLKLDCVVLLILSINFIVCSPSSSVASSSHSTAPTLPSACRLGSQADIDPLTALRHRQNKRWLHRNRNIHPRCTPIPQRHPQLPLAVQRNLRTPATALNPRRPQGRAALVAGRHAADLGRALHGSCRDQEFRNSNCVAAIAGRGGGRVHANEFLFHVDAVSEI
jgi:hypothetical protein